MPLDNCIFAMDMIYRAISIRSLGNENERFTKQYTQAIKVRKNLEAIFNSTLPYEDNLLTSSSFKHQISVTGYYDFSVFSGRLTSGGGFLNNRILFFLLFSGNFCGGQGLDGGRQSRDGGIVSSRPPPHHRKP